MDKLTGKTITALYINKDQSALKVQTTDGELIYKTYGECCSETWIADILGVDALLNSQVVRVEDIALPKYNINDGRCRQKEDLVYCYRITTSRGVCDVIFRNSSNGHYGGWLDLATAESLRGEARIFTEITHDYTAK